jgi:hypothetical protein
MPSWQQRLTEKYHGTISTARVRIFPRLRSARQWISSFRTMWEVTNLLGLCQHFVRSLRHFHEPMLGGSPNSHGYPLHSELRFLTVA